MTINENAIEAHDLALERLPNPHRCPWLVQYLLISPLRRLSEPPDKLVGPYVQRGMTVLDPGCGFGYISLPLARMVGPEGRILSVDIEPRAVQRLLRRASNAGLADRIETRVCQPRDLQLAEYIGEVDLVTVIHTLHEFEDLPGFLAQVSALLKPSGKMLVVEPPGHVKPEHFRAEINCCRRNGFQELQPSPQAKGNMTSLLAPKSHPVRQS